MVMKQNGNILLIEDEQLLMDICDVFLTKLNYRSLKAKTGQEAVKIAETYPGDIEIALLDIGLPDMKGIEVYQKLVKARPNLKVIICSGYSENGPGRDILAAGADAFLQKPFSFSTLSQKINSLIDRRMEKRFKTHQEAVISYNDEFMIDCRIVDISRHGMAFCYPKNTFFSSGSKILTIHATKADFNLKNITCKSVSDIKEAGDVCGKGKNNNRHSVMFKNLSYSQMAQIEEFMVNHSISDSESV